ncbi:MAG TPA: vitamin K epoxide reductase family protein [Streptosporangiaceae bacterium]|nr:vitamin K epoxide reductase family protein [Streptosporangiaceae bacterium]
MTASKSSRARNARSGARAAAARNTAKGGTTVKNGGAAGNSGAARNSAAARSSNAARNGAAARNGGAGTAVRDSNGRDRARTGAPRNGAAARAPRTAEVSAEPAERGPAPWLQIATLVLALAGLGVSIYLTIAHFTESALAGCSESGLVNCTKVTTSPESYVFGIPVAVLGLAFFVFAVAIMSPWAWQSARREVHLVRIASMVVGIGFVLYLIYAELFIIGSICLYCTSVHVITFVLFVLTVFAAAAWGLNPGARWSLIPARQSD